MLIKSFRNRKTVRLGEVLMQRGLISQAQLTQALAEQKQSGVQLGGILVQHGWISPTQLRQALNEQQWRNLAATVLLSATTLLPGTARLATQTPVVAQEHQIAQGKLTLHPDTGQVPFKSAEEKGVSFTSLLDAGGAGTADVAAYAPKSIDPIVLTQQPLAENPTVADPLQGFCHPLNGKGWLSQGIRGRTHQGRMEYAYDLAADIGTPVYAMRPGRVIAVRDKYPDTGGGRDKIAKFNYVWIEHDGGYRSAYIHLQQGFISQVGIKAGDWVEAGQLIGFSGNSGWSTGPHLHLEVQRPGRSRRFSKTAPFAIAGTCGPETIASR